MYGFHFEGHNGNTDEKMFLHINEEKTDEVLSPKDEEKIGQSALATPIDSDTVSLFSCIFYFHI